MPERDHGLRAFRLLLRLYPRSHRKRYGAQMESFFRQERASAPDRPGGTGARGTYGSHIRQRAVFWLGVVADHVEAAWAVRRRTGEGGERMGWLGDDLRFAARTLRRGPAFTAFAVGTLALGIGATTAVFSVLDTVVLRPLPYPDSDRMVLVGIDARHDPGSLGPLSAALVDRFQAAPGPAEALVAATSRGVALHDEHDPVRLDVTRVTEGFFPFFGARPAMGRLLGADDHAVGAPRVVVLGNDLWSTRYGGDPAVVGRSIRMDGQLFTVVGVLSGDFVPPPNLADADDLWVVLPHDDELVTGGSFFMGGAARLRPGATLADLDRHADQVVGEVYSGDGGDFLLGATVRSYRDEVVGTSGRALGGVLAAVGLLLLIACVNVASLLLTRGAQRAREISVRSALGATRGRLVRQLLGESALLAVAGGLAGTGLAWVAVEVFRAYAPPGLPRLAEVGVDGRGLAFSLAVGMGTAVLFGGLPALRSTGRTDGTAQALAKRATGTRREGRLRGSLIAAETALAVVLAVGSALLAQDLLRLTREDPGFQPAGLVTARLDLSSAFQRPEWEATWMRLLDAARELPGVTSAAVATQAPYAGSRMASTIRPEGVPEDAERKYVVQVTVAGDYLGTLGARLLEGRALTSDDGSGTPVMLVNEAFVRENWPGESGVGKRVWMRDSDPDVEYQVVGVVADVRARVGRDTPPQFFLPLAAAPWRDMELILRTDGDALAAVPGLRSLITRVDPTLVPTRIGTVEGLAVEGRARPRFLAALFGGFALVALLLAVVGVYGTTAYATRTRVREIGIRLALGAPRAQVVWTVVLRTAAVVGTGVVVGLTAAVFGSRALAGVLVYVTPSEAPAYGVVALVVLAGGVMAAWIPAARAGGVDPASTLREET